MMSAPVDKYKTLSKLSCGALTAMHPTRNAEVIMCHDKMCDDWWTSSSITEIVTTNRV